MGAVLANFSRSYLPEMKKKKMPELKKFHIVFGGVNVAHLF